MNKCYVCGKILLKIKWIVSDANSVQIQMWATLNTQKAAILRIHVGIIIVYAKFHFNYSKGLVRCYVWLIYHPESERYHLVQACFRRNYSEVREEWLCHLQGWKGNRPIYCDGKMKEEKPLWPLFSNLETTQQGILSCLVGLEAFVLINIRW